MENHETNARQESATSSRDAPLNKLASEIENVRTRDYVQNRLLPQMAWYSKKGNSYKKKYYQLTWLSFALDVAILILVVLLQGSLAIRMLIALCGGGVIAINAYLLQNNLRDLWLTYRNTREVLLRTLYFYFNNSEEFSKGTSEEKDALLIEVCEEELTRENGTWRSSGRPIKEK